MPSFRAAGGTSLGGDSLRPFRISFSRSAYITDVIFFMLCPIPTVATSALVKILPPQQGDRPVRRGRLSAKEPMKGVRLVAYAEFPVADEGSPFGGRCRVSVQWPMQ